MKNAVKNNKFKYSNSIFSQKNRILQYFAQCPRLSTIDARSKLGVLHAAGRVKNLRDDGYLIITEYINQADDNGVSHRIANYVYLGKRNQSILINKEIQYV